MAAWQGWSFRVAYALRLTPSVLNYKQLFHTCEQKKYESRLYLAAIYVGFTFKRWIISYYGVYIWRRIGIFHIARNYQTLLEVFVSKLPRSPLVVLYYLFLVFSGQRIQMFTWYIFPHCLCHVMFSCINYFSFYSGKRPIKQWLCVGDLWTVFCSLFLVGRVAASISMFLW